MPYVSHVSLPESNFNDGNVQACASDHKVLSRRLDEFCVKWFWIIIYMALKANQ